MTTYPTPTIPCISLWQPWATLIAIGAKSIETRSWKTTHRGPIAIHAGKRKVIDELEMIEDDTSFEGALYDFLPLAEKLPFGAIVATARLVDCRRTEGLVGRPILTQERSHPRVEFTRWTEEDFGNYQPGRWGWLLKDIVALEVPVPYVGRQGLFEVPLELIGAGRAVSL